MKGKKKACLGVLNCVSSVVEVFPNVVMATPAILKTIAITLTISIES